MTVLDFYARLAWYDHALHITAGASALAVVLTDFSPWPFTALCWIFANYVGLVTQALQKHIIDTQRELIANLEKCLSTSPSSARQWTDR